MPKGRGPVVVDTTPIIALSLIRRLELLQELYGRLLIPFAVREEIIGSGADRPGAEELASASWIDVAEPKYATLLSDLDRGEAEVIALALERRARLVVIDERLGRLHAKRLRLPLTGTVGVLLRGKRQGLVDAVSPLIEEIQRRGIFLAQDLVAEARRLAGE